MKKEAKLQALNMYLKAAGKVTNREIAKAVKVNALTIGRWKRDENWKAQLEQREGESPDTGGIIRKKAAKDKALEIYMDASGNITNKELAQRVGVSPATISKWKEGDRWIEQLTDPETGNGHSLSKREDDFDLGELIWPEHIIEINRRIDSLLKRDYLAPDEIADLAIAKTDLLDAVETYISIVKEVGELRECG